MVKAICFEYFNFLVVTDFFFLHMSEWLDTIIDLQILEEEKARLINNVEKYINNNLENSRDLLTLSCEGMKNACGELGIILPNHGYDFKSHTKMRIITARLPQTNLKLLQQMKLKFRTGILSRDIDELVMMSYRRLPFKFDFIICTNGETKGKNNKSIYESIASQAGCNMYELLIISDRAHELEFPKQMGIKTLLFDHLKQEKNNDFETFTNMNELEERVLTFL